MANFGHKIQNEGEQNKTATNKTKTLSNTGLSPKKQIIPRSLASSISSSFSQLMWYSRAVAL
jgi:hypothetical protein